MKKLKACIIIGTRPEIIKMSPLIRELKRQNIDFFILHTGQHYSYELDKKIFEDLGLGKIKYNLHVGGNEYRKQVGMMIKNIQRILKDENPDIVFVQGDTNSVLAAAVAANKSGIKLGHHEAGLRSHDLRMLEEINRITTDHISDYLFVPTMDAMKNLKDEGIRSDKIFFTGNTIVDATLQNYEIAEKKSRILEKLKIKPKEYFLVTAHRAENVDEKEKLQGIIDGLVLVRQYFKKEIIFPIHPRTINNLKRFGIAVDRNIRLIDPLGYLDFLKLEGNAMVIITDSGGLQEEASILKVPCVTIRDNTERPETIRAGINILAGTNAKKILDSVKEILKRKKEFKNIFGDGNAAKKIVEAWKNAYLSNLNN